MREDGTYAQIYEKWLGEPLPEDVDDWFLMDAQEAARQFEAQSQGGAAPAPGGATTPGATATGEAEDTEGDVSEPTAEATEESGY